MMKDMSDASILRIFDRNDLNITESTRNNYKNKLIFLSKHSSLPLREIIFAKNPLQLLQSIKESTEETQLVCASSVLAYIKHANLKCKYQDVYDRWLYAYNELEQKKKIRIKSNKPTPRQEKSLLHWENDVIPTRDKLPYGSRDHLLLSMYTYIPPRRQQDYAVMHINRDLGNNNYCDIEQGYCVFREYKTAKNMGEARIELPKDLKNIIKSSLKQEPRYYLFTKLDGSPYGEAFQKQSNLSLKRIFKNNFVSVNALRHSYASYLNAQRTLTLHERETLAHQMGHSLMKNMEYAFL